MDGGSEADLSNGGVVGEADIRIDRMGVMQITNDEIVPSDVLMLEKIFFPKLSSVQVVNLVVNDNLLERCYNLSFRLVIGLRERIK